MSLIYIRGRRLVYMSDDKTERYHGFLSRKIDEQRGTKEYLLHQSLTTDRGVFLEVGL